MLVTTVIEKKSNWSSGPFAGNSQDRREDWNEMHYNNRTVKYPQHEQDLSTLFRYNNVQFHNILVSDLEDVELICDPEITRKFLMAWIETVIQNNISSTGTKKYST